MVRKRTVKKDFSKNSDSIDVGSKSSLYKEFQKEKDEIFKLKWIESEKLGRDIGYEEALFIWFRQHRKSWRAAQMKKRLMRRRDNRFLRPE